MLTTPNPSTLMNAWRTLKDGNTAWGAQKFMEDPKVTDGRITIEGDIHYREYTDWELNRMIELAGFSVFPASYIASGWSKTQRPWKRLLNRVRYALPQIRLLTPGHYMLAEKGA